MTNRPAPAPWARSDALLSAVLGVVGAAAATGGWFVAAGRASTDGQVGPASVAVGGLVLAAVGALCWLRAGRRAIGLRTRSLLGEAPGPHSLAIGRPDSTRLVSAPGLRFYHRMDCPFADRSWPAKSAAGHERAGRAPCRVCRP